MKGRPVQERDVTDIHVISHYLLMSRLHEVSNPFGKSMALITDSMQKDLEKHIREGSHELMGPESSFRVV